MAMQVTPVEKRKGALEGSLGIIGKGVGMAFGGPTGAMIGGAAGDLIGGNSAENSLGKLASEYAESKIGEIKPGGASPEAAAAGSANPVDRRIENLNMMSSMEQGMNAAKQNPNLSREWAPIIEEGLKRSKAYGSAY